MDNEHRNFRNDQTVGIYHRAAVTGQTLDAAAERWVEGIGGAA